MAGGGWLRVLGIGFRSGTYCINPRRLEAEEHVIEVLVEIEVRLDVPRVEKRADHLFCIEDEGRELEHAARAGPNRRCT